MTTGGMALECEQVRFALAAKALGGLDEPEDVLVTEHIRRCTACDAELAEFTTTVSLLATLRSDDPDETPDPDPARAFAALRDEHKRTPPRERPGADPKPQPGTEHVPDVRAQENAHHLVWMRAHHCRCSERRRTRVCCRRFGVRGGG